MTAHELAKMLLAVDDMPVLHHYYYHEDFDDEGYDHFSGVRPYVKGGKVILTTGLPVEED